ncbi:response regulator transcription factor [Cytophagaceae bacterium ABcell3]|nr:response regulator transcription factor [Cytophagaceae bacterium ABcell3]
MGNSQQKILIVDDEPDIVELLQYNLNKEGYDVKSASNGVDAIKLAKEFQPNLILMDIMMPQMDGISTVSQMRDLEVLKDTYIIFLTSRSEEYSEIAAFEAGANDFITKPIKPRALMSRISAYFKRDSQVVKDNNVVSEGDLTIDRGSYTVMKGDQKVVLPKKEFELLFFLASNPGTVYSRDELLKKIWGADVYVVARTVDVHIRKVREKLGDNCIHTVKGIGYKFSPDF